MAGHHPPVTDWATDFDHTDPGWVDDPYPIWDDLRERCPVAHSGRYGGVWLPTRHADIAAVAYDTEHFSSQGVVVSEAKPEDPAPMGGAPPITSDPPFHHLARRLLLPPFSPKAIEALEPATRAVCRSLLDVIGDRDVVDVARDYAQHIPSAVIARMLGLPVEDTELFGTFIHSILENVDAPPAEREEAFEPLNAYLDAAIADHQANPRDDLIGYLLNVEIDGTKLEPQHVHGTILLVLIAGIDTTWSAIGASLWHLARTPADRDRLEAEPALLPTACEELLRAYAPVTMARLVAKEIELGGRLLAPGDWLLLPFPAANRDPAEFDRAGEVVIDRAENRHAAFGLGIHRCLGSNLARMELRVALEEWLAWFPHFEIADPAGVRWAAGQVRGPRTLPVRILQRA
jgi:cytochrome P450